MRGEDVEELEDGIGPGRETATVREPV